jgi:ArsR family transcriptional regulator, arsenate/arsenite/antimonite-responsive transcriptional repressor
MRLRDAHLARMGCGTLRMRPGRRRPSLLIPTYVDMSPLATASLAGPRAASRGASAGAVDPSLDVERIAVLAKALAEPLRVSVLDVLRRSGEPLCQCQLMPLFAVPQSTLSHHINKLVAAHLVAVERRHRWAYYTIDAEPLEELRAWLS